MSKLTTRLAVATATLTIAAAVTAPQAMALSKAERMAEAANNKVEALEAQLQQMQYELQALRAEANRPQVDHAAKVQELDEWMNEVKSQPEKGKDNLVFFRGGYGHMDSKRGGILDPTAPGGQSGGALNGEIGNQDAWYFGAGFDWSLNDNLWGVMEGTEVFAELMFDYKELGDRALNGLTSTVTGIVANPGTLPSGAAVNSETATVNMLTLAASPKIKFLKGQAFRPWLIPIGFEINVISPPSNAITVLNPGMQFGAGADYRVWDNLYVGLDARYHYTPDNTDGVNTNGVTAGGYLGIGF